MSEATSPPERRVLELLRARPIPPMGARDRVRERLLTTISGPGGNGPAGGGGPAAAAGLGKAPIAGIALLVGGAVGALLHSALALPSPPVVVYVDRPVVAAATAFESSPPAASAPSVVPLIASSAPVGSSRAPSRFAGPSQLAAERALLDQARAALVEGDPARAIERIDKHRRAFLNPMLAEERDAMEVEALVRAGRSAEARARADAFRRHSPDSLFMPTVQSAIASIP